MEFKDEKARTTYPQLKEHLKDALYEADQWAKNRKLPFVITRCIDGMIPGVSKTDIHSKARAADASIKGWAADEIDDFLHDMNERFSESIGAVSISDGKKRFLIMHPGTASHFHFQVREIT